MVTLMEESTKPTDAEIGAMFLGEGPEEPVEAESTEEVGEYKEEEIVDSEASEEVSEDDSEEVEAKDTQDGEEDTQDGGFVEVEWEGQLIEAPKSIADALMRQSDYTQKTQEIAAQRKAFEVAQGQINELQGAYEFAKSIQTEQLEMQQADSMISQWEQHLSQNAKEMSAQDIALVQLEIKNLEKFKADKHNELSNKQQEFQQAREQSMQELLNKGTEVLRSRIPGWGDEHKAAIRDYGLNNGFTESEISSVIDPRQVEVLWKASQYDKLQQGKTAAVKKVKESPTIRSKPRNPMPKDVREKLDLRNKLKSKKLSAKDKQSLIAQDIGKRWG